MSGAAWSSPRAALLHGRGPTGRQLGLEGAHGPLRHVPGGVLEGVHRGGLLAAPLRLLLRGLALAAAAAAASAALSAASGAGGLPLGAPATALRLLASVLLLVELDDGLLHPVEVVQPHLLDRRPLHLLELGGLLLGQPLQLLLPLLRERHDVHDEQVLEARPGGILVAELLEPQPCEVLHQVGLLPVVDAQLLRHDHGDEPRAIRQEVALQRQLVDQVLLPVVVVLQADPGELLNDLEGVLVLLDLSVAVEENHVCLGEVAPQLKGVFDAGLLRLGHLLLRHLHREVRLAIGVVLPDVLHRDLGLGVAPRQHPLQELFVVLRPLPDRELGDLEPVVRLPVLAPGVVALLPDRLDGAGEAAVPRLHGLHLLLSDPGPEVVDDCQRVVVRHIRAPASPNSGGPVDKHHGDAGNVEARLDHLAVLVEVREDRVVEGGEDEARQRAHPGVDVPSTGVVAASLEAGAELAGGDQQVQVVGAHEVLRHGDDRAGQGGLAVMIGAVLADVADQLRDLHVAPQIPLEAAEEDLALRGLKAVHHGWDAAHDAVLGELDELQLHEVLVGDAGLRVVHEGALHVVVHPGLAVVGARLAEGHVDELAVLL
mmetsp:Transcript_16996/g.37428  ORF Transcript_16996/g.37428 Transcript_16996/m.37428 type:complete len:599 (+) Transcript_16996:369-2165(+)